jgi:hypothetical protein
MTTSIEICGVVSEMKHVDGRTPLYIFFMLWSALKFAEKISVLSLTNRIHETGLDGSVVNACGLYPAAYA